jgi:hypothetical protein
MTPFAGVFPVMWPVGEEDVPLVVELRDGGPGVTVRTLRTIAAQPTADGGPVAFGQVLEHVALLCGGHSAARAPRRTDIPQS